MIISSKEFANLIGDGIEHDLIIALFSRYDKIAEVYGLERPNYSEFEDALYEGPLADMREAVLEFYQSVGMDIQPDDTPF